VLVRGIGPYFHVGHVVPDLAAAMARLEATAGFRWAAPRVLPVSLRTVEGQLSTEVHLTYSVDGPPYLELIEEQPGTIWSREQRGLHHLGYWSSRFTEDIDRLVQDGFAFETGAVDAQGALARFVYLREPHTGLRIELRDETRRAAMEQWLHGEAP
jgi:Glyoxalase/Bleomycin resistance protein/Dioxygenase superfamily